MLHYPKWESGARRAKTIYQRRVWRKWRQILDACLTEQNILTYLSRCSRKQGGGRKSESNLCRKHEVSYQVIPSIVLHFCLIEYDLSISFVGFFPPKNISFFLLQVPPQYPPIQSIRVQFTSKYCSTDSCF